MHVSEGVIHQITDRICCKILFDDRLTEGDHPFSMCANLPKTYISNTLIGTHMCTCQGVEILGFFGKLGLRTEWLMLVSYQVPLFTW